MAIGQLVYSKQAKRITYTFSTIEIAAFSTMATATSEVDNMDLFNKALDLSKDSSYS